MLCDLVKVTETLGQHINEPGPRLQENEIGARTGRTAPLLTDYDSSAETPAPDAIHFPEIGR